MIDRKILLLGCLCVGIAFLAGSVSAEHTSQPIQSLRQQLAQLDPDNLEGYLRIGESLGVNTNTDSDRTLAMQTLAIGIGLTQRSDNPKLAASMCIALATVEPNPTISSALWDLALILDPNRRASWLVHRDTQEQELAQLKKDAARCLYAARFNDPKLATELLGQREIREAIRQAARDADLDPSRIDRVLSEMISLATDDDCRGRVFIAERNDGELRRVVCRDHLRPIGTALDDDSLRQFIKLELILLGQFSTGMNQQAWETNAYLGLDEPARDPSASMIIQHYQVNLSRPYWRGERWASSR